MPMFHFTFHGYATWMPDHTRGYHIRHHGWQPPDIPEGKRYSKRTKIPAVYFSYRQQRTCIENLIRRCDARGFILAAAVSDRTHFHIMVAWEDARLSWRRVAADLKGSMTRHLNKQFGPRPHWFSKGCGHKQVRRRKHLDRLLKSYLPKHRGWMWTREMGWSMLRDRKKWRWRPPDNSFDEIR